MLVKSQCRPLSTPGPRMRAIAAAWATSFGETVDDVEQWAKTLGDARAAHAHTYDFSFNRPSLGVQETFGWSKYFREKDRHADVFQVEFERSQLIGHRAAESMRGAGESWPPEEFPEDVADTVEKVAQKLQSAHDRLRS